MIDYLWLPGETLIKMVDEYLWFFAVFSGFPKEISKEQV
jgi:hypothetical protein